MKNMGCVLCLVASTQKKMINGKRRNTKKMDSFPCLAVFTPKKMTKGKKKSPQMTLSIMKRLMKAFQVRCIIIMKKRLSMLISLVLKDILNSPNNDLGEFYASEENYMFTRETIADPFLSIFMARGWEKEREKYGKVEYLPSDVRGFNYKYRGMPMMKNIEFIMVYYLVLILRKNEWNKLTGHQKDREKNRLNLRSNSLQSGENYADRHPITKDRPDGFLSCLDP